MSPPSDLNILVAGAFITRDRSLPLYPSHHYQRTSHPSRSEDARASLFSSASDYAKFMVVMLGGVRGTPLRWGLELTSEGEMFWHWGNNDGYRSLVAADRQQRRPILVLTNGTNSHKLYSRLVRDATGIDHHALMWFRT